MNAIPCTQPPPLVQAIGRRRARARRSPSPRAAGRHERRAAAASADVRAQRVRAHRARQHRHRRLQAHRVRPGPVHRPRHHRRRRTRRRLGPDARRVSRRPTSRAMHNAAFGVQGTGGSTAMANSWTQLRNAGAEARAMLVAAAATEWNVDAGEITVDKGVRRASRRQAGDVRRARRRRRRASRRTGQADAEGPGCLQLHRQARRRASTRVAKTNGTAQYTIDVKLPDMLTCVIARPPRFGAQGEVVRPAPALAVPGVKDVFAVPHGVAVLANGYWAARKGRDALKVEWDEIGHGSARHRRARSPSITTLADNDGRSRAQRRRCRDGARRARQGHRGDVYEFPYLAHAPMEPNDCVIRHTDDGGARDAVRHRRCQTVDQAVAASVLGLEPER